MTVLLAIAGVTVLTCACAGCMTLAYRMTLDAELAELFDEAPLVGSIAAIPFAIGIGAALIMAVLHGATLDDIATAGK